MEIKFLTRFSKIKSIGGWETKGLSINQIVELENKYNNGNKFPVAYREYLYIGGESHGLRLDEGKGFDWLYEMAQKELDENGQSIDRPYFVIDQLDACEQFGFIYLDESEEDPIVYICKPPYVQDGFNLIEPYEQKQLSNVIDALIDSAEAWDQVRGQYDPDDA